MMLINQRYTELTPKYISYNSERPLLGVLPQAPQGLRNWIFSAKIITGNGTKSYVDLFEASTVPVKRHIKIKAEATPYDPCFIEYFEKRKRYLKATRTGSKQPAMIK